MSIDMAHYIKKCKEHEACRASTNVRNAYWKQYGENINNLPQSAARFEHG